MKDLNGVELELWGWNTPFGLSFMSLTHTH